MSRHKKILIWATASIGTLFILLLALFLLLPRLVNQEPLRGKILASISQAAGGGVDFQKVDLSFFPRPCVVVHEGRLSIPGKLTADVESVTICPKILPLFTGRVRIGMLEVETPDVKVKLPQRPEKNNKGLKGFSLATVKEKVAPALALAALKAPGLVVVVEKGNLDLSVKDESLFCFHGIDAHIGLPPNSLNIDVTCQSNFWEKICIDGRLDLHHFEAKGRIDLTQFRLQALTRYLPHTTAQYIGDSRVNLNLSFRTDGLKVLQAEMQGSIPDLTLHKGNERLVIKGTNLKASLLMDEHKTTVVLNELNLDYPQLNITGKLVTDQTPPQLSLELEGREVDVHSTREAALALAGDTKIVREIFDIVKGGKVPLINLSGHGSSLADLGNLENILIKGTMVDGKIFVPKADFDLENVKGKVIISKGVLWGENLEARLGNAQGREGNLKLGLKGKNAPFHLDIGLQADLDQVSHVLRRFVHNKSFVKELDFIEDLKGNATGRLVLGESTAAINTRVDVSGFHLSANYQRIPYPLEINGGHFSYDKMGISLDNVSGKLGRSSFSKISSVLDWKKGPRLEVKSGKSEVFLEEIHRCLVAFEGLSVYLKNLKGMKGVIAFSALSLKGPLLEPKDWDFEMTGEVRHLAVDTSLFPGPIEVTKGNFDAITQKLALKDARINMLDASLEVSGVLYDYLSGINGADISLQGDMRSKSIRWLSNLIHIPPALKVRSPLSVSQGRLIWGRGAKTTFTGDLAIQNGPRVSINVYQDSEELMIKHLLIQDEGSRAHLRLNVKKKEFGFEFAGHVTKTTMDRLLEKNQFSKGWIKGDIRAQILMDQPVRSTAQGKLTGRGLVFPWQPFELLKIDSVSLHATKNNVKVESAIFTWGDKQFILEGNVDVSGTGFVLDMDLSADSLEWSQVKKIVEKEDRKRDAPPDENLWDLPVQGSLRLKLGTFKYEEFTWNPFHADIAFTPNGIDVAVTEADLCGISTPGFLKISPQQIVLDFKPVSKNQELAPTLTCLGDKKGRVTGRFDLQGEVTAGGKSEDLAKSIRGNLKFVANDGRIHRLGLLAKIFHFLNVTETFRGKFPDLRQEGFAYNSMTAKGDIQGGKLVLKEAIIDSDSMKIACVGDIGLINKQLDLKVMVAPLKSVDSIVEKIPLVNDILNGTLVSIPVKVTGDLTDPTITPLSASAVGSGLLGIVERTLKLPVKVMESLPGREK